MPTLLIVDELSSPVQAFLMAANGAGRSPAFPFSGVVESRGIVPTLPIFRIV
jgi:hypothetical protein